MDELDKLLQQVKDEVDEKPRAVPPPIPKTKATPQPTSSPDLYSITSDDDPLLASLTATSDEDPLLASLRSEVEAESVAKAAEWQKQQKEREQAEARRAAEQQRAEQQRIQAEARRQQEEQRAEARRLEMQRQEEARRAAEQQRAEQQRIQEEARRQQEEQRRRQEAEAKKKALMVKDAEEFLKKLNPKSPDAKWFEKFATNYSTRLEAAIEYLQSLEEAGH